MPNIDWSTPTIQVAIISLMGLVLAALVGLGGVFLGGRISAEASRDAARISSEAAERSAQVARQIAQADRDEAAAVRFDDRIRDLASQMLAGGGQYIQKLYLQAELSQRGKRMRKPPETPEAFWRAYRELDLLVRGANSYAAVERLAGAVSNAYMTALVTPVADITNELADDSRKWLASWHEYWRATVAFEDAIRMELSRPPIERSPGPGRPRKRRAKGPVD